LILTGVEPKSNSPVLLEAQEIPFPENDPAAGTVTPPFTRHWPLNDYSLAATTERNGTLGNPH
jgi:hypothetical protein